MPRRSKTPAGSLLALRIAGAREKLRLLRIKRRDEEDARRSRRRLREEQDRFRRLSRALSEATGPENNPPASPWG